MIEQLRSADWYRILRYLIVGGLNASMSLGVYYFALTLLGWPYYAASALSVVSGIIVGFKAHGALVFKGTGSFFRYVGVWAALYLANIVSIWLIRDYTGDYWAPIILLPITVLTSYFLLKKLIYKPQEA
jgi:putative flippase GtrA